MLLETVRESGGDGREFGTEWGGVSAIFFLNLKNRVYMASLSQESYVVSALINQPNRLGGAVSAFGHYCFQESEVDVLHRLDEFYEKMSGPEFFDLQEEIRVNHDVDFIIQSLAGELGFIF